MNPTRPLIRRLMLAALIVVGGCTSSSEEPTESAAVPSVTTQEIREVAASDLPALADPAPTSDPAVEAAGPQGWKRLPRKDEQYLVGWYGASQPNVLPRIFVRSEDWTGKVGETTSENVTALAEEIEQALRVKEDQVLEWPRAMLLGGQPWVRYVEQARLGSARAEKQILQRVVGDRLYTVELQIYHGKIREARDHAYAVAAGLKFQPKETPRPEDQPPAGDPPSGEPPADSAAPATNETTSPDPS